MRDNTIKRNVAVVLSITFSGRFFFFGKRVTDPKILTIFIHNSTNSPVPDTTIEKRRGRDKQ